MGGLPAYWFSGRSSERDCDCIDAWVFGRREPPVNPSWVTAVARLCQERGLLPPRKAPPGVVFTTYAEAHAAMLRIRRLFATARSSAKLLVDNLPPEPRELDGEPLLPFAPARKGTFVKRPLPLPWTVLHIVSVAVGPLSSRGNVVLDADYAAWLAGAPPAAADALLCARWAQVARPLLVVFACIVQLRVERENVFTRPLPPAWAEAQTMALKRKEASARLGTSNPDEVQRMCSTLTLGPDAGSAFVELMRSTTARVVCNNPLARPSDDDRQHASSIGPENVCSELCSACCGNSRVLRRSATLVSRSPICGACNDHGHIFGLRVKAPRPVHPHAAEALAIHNRADAIAHLRGPMRQRIERATATLGGQRSEHVYNVHYSNRPMLRAPLIGRYLALYGCHYVLCPRCGVLMLLDPLARGVPRSPDRVRCAFCRFQRPKKK